MTIALIALIVSVLAMVVMLYVKMHEGEIGRYRFFPAMRAQGDHHARKAFGFFRQAGKIASNRKFWVALGIFVVKEVKDNIIFNEKVVRFFKKVSNAIRGRKTIKHRGPVSFYLQDVSEYKNKLQT